MCYQMLRGAYLVPRKMVWRISVVKSDDQVLQVATCEGHHPAIEFWSICSYWFVLNDKYALLTQVGQMPFIFCMETKKSNESFRKFPSSWRKMTIYAPETWCKGTSSLTSPALKPKVGILRTSGEQWIHGTWYSRLISRDEDGYGKYWSCEKTLADGDAVAERHCDRKGEQEQSESCDRTKKKLSGRWKRKLDTKTFCKKPKNVVQKITLSKNFVTKLTLQRLWIFHALRIQKQRFKRQGIWLAERVLKCHPLRDNASHADSKRKLISHDEFAFV